VSQNNLTMVATDRYRVAVRAIDWDSGTNVIDETLTALGAAHAAKSKQDIRTQQRLVAITNTSDRELSRLPLLRSQDGDFTSDKGQLPTREARLFPETVDNYAVINTAGLIGRCGGYPRARAGGAAIPASRSTASPWEAIGWSRPGPPRNPDRRAHLSGEIPSRVSQEARLPPGRPGRGALQFGCGSRSPKRENPNKPGQCITSRSSRINPGADNYKYLCSLSPPDGSEPAC
jgi:DNA polymerase-3 subunit beta